ncbi:hypothetical protein QBC35DRAFT_489480 [Podospora australis]|uniref:Uncharacterized protein n=1 Tax=Podospora australis TaxID=1536484 RepID=A0AAN6WYT1_9PEZI|nr:hypothetical protein QBC35DRAFT_489480 [Podospora australis]
MVQPLLLPAPSVIPALMLTVSRDVDMGEAQQSQPAVPAQQPVAPVQQTAMLVAPWAIAPVATQPQQPASFQFQVVSADTYRKRPAAPVQQAAVPAPATVPVVGASQQAAPFQFQVFRADTYKKRQPDARATSSASTVPAQAAPTVSQPPATPAARPMAKAKTRVTAKAPTAAAASSSVTSTSQTASSSTKANVVGTSVITSTADGVKAKEKRPAEPDTVLPPVKSAKAQGKQPEVDPAPVETEQPPANLPAPVPGRPIAKCKPRTVKAPATAKEPIVKIMGTKLVKFINNALPACVTWAVAAKEAGEIQTLTPNWVQQWPSVAKMYLEQEHTADIFFLWEDHTHDEAAGIISSFYKSALQKVAGIDKKGVNGILRHVQELAAQEGIRLREMMV